MKRHIKISLKSIAVVCSIAVLFSCTNDMKQVRDFLAAKNLPTGIAKNMHHIYKDSGRITSKLTAPLLHDYSNRKEHPYNEFPEGIKIVNFAGKDGKDSVTIIGDYAQSYSKTLISEIKGSVVVLNHSENSRLETVQLFWDQNTKYFYSEKPFRLITKKDTINGIGFESKEDLSKWLSKNITGKLETDTE